MTEHELRDLLRDPDPLAEPWWGRVAMWLAWGSLAGALLLAAVHLTRDLQGAPESLPGRERTTDADGPRPGDPLSRR